MSKKNVYCLFAYAFCSAAAYVVGRSVADGLYLSFVGPEGIPVLHVGSAFALAVLSFVYSHVARFVRVEALARLTSIFLAISSFAAPYILAKTNDDYWTLAALYVLAEVRGGLGSIMLALLINERLRSDSARDSLGFIGSGATLAGILFGGFVGLEAKQLHLSNLLFIGSFVEFLSVLPISLVSRSQDGTVTGFGHLQRLRRAKKHKPRKSSSPALRRWRLLLQSRFTIALAIATAFQTSIALGVEYQWKTTASVRFGDPEQLTMFFGDFYGGLYLLTGLLQLRTTAWFLRRFGQPMSLLAFPVSLLLTVVSTFFLMNTRFAVVGMTVAKGCDCLKRSLHDPAVQLLYQPLSNAKRRRLVTLITGVIKPFSEALIASFIFQLTPNTMFLNVVLFGLLLAWIASLLATSQLHAAETKKA